jgi:hypothetical protein
MMALNFLIKNVTEIIIDTLYFIGFFQKDSISLHAKFNLALLR